MGLKEDLGKKAIEVAGDNSTKLFGMLFPYAGTRKNAVDLYCEEVEKSNLSTETKVYMLMNAKCTIKKIKNQKAIADIAINNAKDGTDFSEKSGVNEEWLERFMDSGSYVSEESVQIIWGKVLAGEFEHPGSTPPSMRRILSELTLGLAKVFETICGMRAYICLLDSDDNILDGFSEIIVPYSGNQDTVFESGISLNSLNELETVGLIKIDTIGSYATTNKAINNIIVSDGRSIGIIRDLLNNELPIGNVMLTSAGETLCSIIKSVKVQGYFQLLQNYYRHMHYELDITNDFKFIERDGMQVIVRKDM